MLYIKELDNVEEIFENAIKYPKVIRYIIYFFKKIFCILTIKDEKVCVLPYKKIKSKVIIETIGKIISKITHNVVLSNYLNDIELLKLQFQENKINIYKGDILCKYLIYNFVEYILKQRGEECYNQEICILVNDLTKLDENNIIYFCKKFKRINIVTKNINKFKRLEKYLEEEGIAITITNNKRKSLLKAKIIINLDFDEELLNSFNINQNAIILEIGEKAEVKSKLFNGINILDYQIVYDTSNIKLDNINYKKFDKKLIYESIASKNEYEDVINMINRDNVRIVNLIGKNGIIQKQEYRKI